MIARIIIPLILMIVLSDLYIDKHYLRHRVKYTWWKRMLWWIPGAVMLVLSVVMAFSKNFVPENTDLLYGFLFLIGLLVVPKALYALCSFLGWRLCRLRKKRINWGNLLGLVLAFYSIYVLVYGCTIGFHRLEVKHLDYTFEDLPAAFDGYRIVQFSDIHVGSYTDSRKAILTRALDSINAQNADAIVFTGDILNARPHELYPVMNQLSQLKAKDGVFSILGNHDYSYYTRNDDPAIRAANERETVSRERQMGWQLLLNEHKVIKRGKEAIVIAGMENLGKEVKGMSPDYPMKGDVKKTLEGVSDDAFVVMLQHEPWPWRHVIRPERKVQLTLSGHTHGGQITFFGFSPMGALQDEWSGEYREGNSILYVSNGLGGVIPLRFGATGEIVVITLHRKR